MTLRTLPVALALAGLCLAAPGPAFAQGNPASIGSPGAPNGKANANAPRREQAPPALPGARAEPAAVAPPPRNAPDMPPTEALFDSINRGDLASAKDAINRGADINGHNVLGLTPLELSVDLGRNQISFLLLSLRGGAGYTTSRGPASGTASGTARGGAEAGGPTPRQTRAERQAAARAERQERLDALKAERAERAERAGRGPIAEPAPATPQAPRLFGNNGGTPVPQAGFLGFDSGR